MFGKKKPKDSQIDQSGSDVAPQASIPPVPGNSPAEAADTVVAPVPSASGETIDNSVESGATSPVAAENTAMAQSAPQSESIAAGGMQTPPVDAPIAGDASAQNAAAAPQLNANQATESAASQEGGASQGAPVQSDASQQPKQFGAVSHDGMKAAISTAQKSAESDVLKYTSRTLETPDYIEAKKFLIDKLVNRIDFAVLQQYELQHRQTHVAKVADDEISRLEIPLTSAQIDSLREQVMDEILGLGPLEPLLADPDIADIMINTAKQVYVEKGGKIHLTDITFIDEQHLMGIIQRIVSRVGRRVDESSPMVDARLEDGSRFNAIIPPLALDGCLVSIRKFKQNKIALKDYVDYDSMSADMCRFLEICAKIRLNIIISGGTGSGKTTLLNALSGHISEDERVITIEDAAEIQMKQPHVLRLETRPASTEGKGEVTQRQLVKNALRMRPDRIILGEIRGDEVIDVLAAMNTGHDGSFATIHANNPRDCLLRIENLVGMSGVKVTENSLRYQIASAVNLIVQLSRMRDGRRRITHIEEIVSVDGDVICTQTLFEYKAAGTLGADGILHGTFEPTGIRPKALSQAEYYGLGEAMSSCFDFAGNM